MDIIPDKRKLVGLVEQAWEGKLCLPDFQRDFVWTREDVADLVRSVLRGYFVGSLLLLRCDPDKPPFAPVWLRGAKPLLNEPRPDLLVLDGQQRLTSLLYALTAPDLRLKDSSQRRWFFINLDLLLDDPDNNEFVFDRAKKELDGLDAPKAQFARHVLPCTTLLREGDFFTWSYGFEDWARANSPADLEQFREKWRGPWSKAVTDFRGFLVPLVELPRVEDDDSQAIGRVCAIFEKLNSTGVELSVYDLLTARLYRSGIKLHDLWDAACRNHLRLAEWSGGKAEKDKFGVQVLRTLALMRGLDPKPRILIDLSPKDFERDWARAAAAVDRALELLTDVGQDGFGVFDRRWLPGFGPLPALAALRAHIEDCKLGDQARADLRRWYWCNVFLERYSSAVESKSRKDWSEFTDYWEKGKPAPSVFGEAQARLGATAFSVRDSASHASAVYCGIFCMLALRNARDWRRIEDIRLQDLQDHHIFPQAYLKRHGVKDKVTLNSVVNRTLISDETNNKIKADPPGVYLGRTDIFPAGASLGLLAPHFLDAGTLDAMRQATESLSGEATEQVYEAFRTAREAAIVCEIRNRCGVVPPKHEVSATGG